MRARWSLRSLLTRLLIVEGAILAWTDTALADGGAPPAAVAPELHLEWHAPAGCPSREVVLEHVASLVADGAVRWGRFDAIVGTLRPGGARWRLQLDFQAP